MMPKPTTLERRTALPTKPRRPRTFRVTQKSLDARDLAMRLMRQYGLHDWCLAFNGRKRTLGLCWYERKVIALSVHLCELNPPEIVEDTIRHEIAHALAGPGTGHGPVWQAMAREVGADPKRACTDCVMPVGRWQATCPGCGQAYHRHRRPRRLNGWYCPPCGPERGALIWQRLASPTVTQPADLNRRHRDKWAFLPGLGEPGQHTEPGRLATS
jgi:predicted SprT family Zn-dependent metalloprotease